MSNLFIEISLSFFQIKTYKLSLLIPDLEIIRFENIEFLKTPNSELIGFIILIAFFGLPSAGVYLSSFFVLFIILTLVLAAFSEEIVWAGLTSVDSGQWKAARSTGLSLNQTLIWIILPQAFRLAIPPLTNRAIAITKMTALGTVIGVPDILNQATTAQSFSGNASPLMIAAIIYVIIFLPLVIASRWLEEKFSWRKA